jgi:hypothetical protein
MLYYSDTAVRHVLHWMGKFKTQFTWVKIHFYPPTLPSFMKLNKKREKNRPFASLPKEVPFQHPNPAFKWGGTSKNPFNPYFIKG